VVTAENGKINIPEKIRDKFGERFHLVQKLDRIILLPVSGEPLKALRDEMGDIEKSVDQLKQEALDPETKN